MREGLGTNRLIGPGLRTFVRIADAWDLDNAERARLLGLPALSYADAVREPSRAVVGDETLDRLSHILGIYKALHVIFPRTDIADGWISRPNRDFAGRTARERITSGRLDELEAVRRYLDAQRG
jgi:Protein of unknown function (DUF2384)